LTKIATPPFTADPGLPHRDETGAPAKTVRRAWRSVVRSQPCSAYFRALVSSGARSGTTGIAARRAAHTSA
jgi:hypothetical protein